MKPWKRCFVCIAVSLLWAISPSLLFVVGCQGTSYQQTAYITTEALGKAADTVTKAFTDYEANKAKADLIKAKQVPTADAIFVTARGYPEWQKFSDAHAKYIVAYSVWCNANAVAATGTNAASALANPQFRTAAIAAAQDLASFVATFVSTGSAGKTIYTAR